MPSIAIAPSLHFVHCTLPVPGETKLASHGVHFVLPVEDEYVPAGHLGHTPPPKPVLELYVPAMQG
jgi:hypothetical protein